MKETGSLMRCLHCGNRISLLRKLKDSEFCSDEHRDFYALQQQQMAVSRLMETSSPKHKPLPGLRPDPESDPRALPKGADRRGLATAPDKPSRPPVQPAVAPSAPAASEVQQQRAAVVATPPPPSAAVETPAPAAAPPPSAPPPRGVQPGFRNSTLAHGFVSQFPPNRDWLPRRQRAVEVEAEDLTLQLAAPRFQEKGRRRLNLQGMVALSRSHEWCRVGRQVSVALCQPAMVPASPSTFSEILSLSMHGFVCERALALDRSPYVPQGDPLPAVQAFEPRIAPTAEAGLGIAQLPRACDQPAPKRTIEAIPGPMTEQPARPEVPVRGQIALWGQLPEIDWTVERLDGIAARHEPGLVKLRSPRVRSPQLARLVKPAAGNSGPPIRVRPSVRPPKASVSQLVKLAMPRGAKVPLRFDTPVVGRRALLDLSEEPLSIVLAVRRVAHQPPMWSAGMTLAGLVPLSLRSGAGVALAEATTPALPEWAAPELALPRGPFVRGNDFDPPRCGMVRLTFFVQPRRMEISGPAIPAMRPVISYRWVPIKPELHIAPEADWGSAPRSMAQLTVVASARKEPPALAPLPLTEPLDAVMSPSVAGVRLAAGPMARSSRPTTAGRMMAISLDKCTAKSGNEAPISRLEQISPRPSHQLRKSSLKTVADWQRSRWSSASVYGSALWRIAIGKFSGALDQAPKTVRWGAALGALLLGAFALLPGDGPTVPGDTAWTIANNPGATPAAAPDGQPTGTLPPPPRRVKAPPPARPTPVKGTKAVRAQTPAAAGPGSDQGIGLTSAWDNFQRRLSDRAAVAYTDDFRNGLAEWEGAGDWARSWSYDASGFVRTGGLALLAPSRDLTDYRMEFLGQIERRSMGWVVRAADMRNYFALKLTVVADGPVPEVAFIRYPVINGVAGAASQQLLPISVRSDTVYRVQTEVRGDYYAVTVQGKVVDSWTDARLKRGSIGLFSGKGELARVRWVGVWHQYDTLGRLCALLAPSGLPGRERGANQ
jgi:hypothetical protein